MGEVTWTIIPVSEWENEDCYEWAHSVAERYDLYRRSVNITPFRMVTGATLLLYDMVDFHDLIENFGRIFYNEFKALLDRHTAGGGDGLDNILAHDFGNWYFHHSESIPEESNEEPEAVGGWGPIFVPPTEEPVAVGSWAPPFVPTAEGPVATGRWEPHLVPPVEDVRAVGGWGTPLIPPVNESRSSEGWPAPHNPPPSIPTIEESGVEGGLRIAEVPPEEEQGAVGGLELPINYLELFRCIKVGNGRTRGPKTFEFLIRLLVDNGGYPQLIRWENQQEYTFKLMNPRGIAQIWGTREGRSTLSYKHFSRSLRYHYQTDALSETSNRLIYQLGPVGIGFLRFTESEQIRRNR